MAISFRLELLCTCLYIIATEAGPDKGDNVLSGKKGDSFVPIGRPREFELDKALDAALKVFWRKGYEGASLPDLTKAMGINRPSLYAAFGNKEALFRKAIDRYIEGPASHIRDALQQPTARAVVERLWSGSINLTTGSRTPRGCFLVQAALACGTEAECVRRDLAKRRARLETLLRERFERAVSEGDLPSSVDPADLAKYVATVANGIAVQAAGGATRDELRRVADMALVRWPT
jgi:AcrR family transcriptional regulator